MNADLGQSLAALCALADEAAASGIAGEATALAGRLAEGRFFVACLGQFKRGKSTLINALIGEPILPTGVVPVTSALTILRHGVERGARVVFSSGEITAIDPADLASFVTEEHNPENIKGVAAVEVCVPSPLLASGMCLVDTPGLGSIFAGNTAVTQQFLPHVDAALVVLGADPPISGEELGAVESVAQETTAIVVVLNKADRVSPAELEEARAFAARALAARLGRPIGPLLSVSATEAQRGAAGRDWRGLTDALDAMATGSGADLVRRAHVRGLGRLVDRLLAAIAEQRGALTRPQAESEARVDRLRACVADAERALRDLGPLFKAEEARLARAFAEEQARFLASAGPDAARALDESMDAVAREPGARLRERSASLARATAERVITGWAARVEPTAEELYRGAMARFVALGNGVLRELSDVGDAAGEGAVHELPGEAGFRTRRRFQFHDLLTLGGPGPLTRIFDRLRSRSGVAVSAKVAARAFLDHLLATNSARVANDLTERVVESRRRLEAELLGLLRDLSAEAERSLDQARRTHAEGADAVAAALSRLDSLQHRTEALRPPP
jgi:GTP-binding protein EngB required for normal cell division